MQGANRITANRIQNRRRTGNKGGGQTNVNAGRRLKRSNSLSNIRT